ncbi:hypothetical protein [Flavobacterium polysaccharolyticum]|uniref:Uncharacterized protein n=1 Tax=Flavobacterium polysaccharolyticum TaxID=3133148 RepID=A0ABU9NNL5_9FLAO
MKRTTKYLALLSLYFFSPVFIMLVTTFSSNDYGSGIAVIVFLLILFYINFLVAENFFKVLLWKRVLLGIIITVLGLYLTYMFAMLNIFPRSIDQSGKLTSFFMNGLFSLFIWEISYQVNKRITVANKY